MQVSKCRSCGADISWIRMASGKMTPVDAQRISFRPGAPGVKGVQTYVMEDGRISFGWMDPAGDKVGYISHFATCPAAGCFRKRDLR